MKKIFVLIAVLTAMLLTVGMAHAVVIEGNGTSTSNVMGNGNQGAVKVYGIFDDAPGRDIVIPFICGKDADNGLNTLFSIAETFAANRNNKTAVVSLHRQVYDVKSVHVYDDYVTLTGFDILPGDCKSLVARMSTAQKAKIEKVIGGKTYYTGYIWFENISAVKRDNLISWVYFVDLAKGFAAGVNGFSFQGGVSGNLCETFGITPVCSTAAWMYPRFFILNDAADSFNWFVILSGTNAANRTLGRGTEGVLCDEDENCISLDIPIPDELNIISVAQYIPAGLFRAYPYAGFGVFPVNPYANNNTIVGWSYQSAASTSGASLSWSAFHPIHKDY